MTTLGFVGLGHIGGKRAARFLAAGYTVYCESRDRRHADDLVHKGLQWRNTPCEVAGAADVLITSGPDDDVPEAVASGPDGVLAGSARRHTSVRTAKGSCSSSRSTSAWPYRWPRSPRVSYCLNAPASIEREPSTA